MSRIIVGLVALSGLLGSGSAQRSDNGTGSGPDSATVKWLGRTPSYSAGTTFGLPWSRGKHFSNSTEFTVSGGGALQTWVTAYWSDGSIKWTGHAIPESESILDEYTVSASSSSNSTTRFSRARRQQQSGSGSGITVSDSADAVSVDTGKLAVTFPKSGSAVVGEIKTASGKTIGQNGRLVLHSQSGVEDQAELRGQQADIKHFNFESNVEEVTVSKDNVARALVTVRGKHAVQDGSSSSGSHADWLPFVLRFYLYHNSEAIRIVHTVIYDGNAEEDFISGLGIRFEVPLEGEEQYNRHVRISGIDGGLLSEAVQGITGLRRDPGASVRNAQFEGAELADPATWDQRVTTRLHWIPTWSDFSLTQLSPDGFTLKKRTKAGQSWVNIPGGTRAGGLAYLGGATKGGLAVGLRNFWKRYPTGIDITNAAAEDKGEITIWIYSPAAPALDIRPYHDGLGQDTYAEQLDALEITYEDYEPGFNTPYGVARTNEIFVYGFESTPNRTLLSDLTEHTNNPPVLYGEPEYLAGTKALGNYWSPPAPSPRSGVEADIEKHLDFLFRFYEEQVEQRKWYGFWDHGDFIHAYDPDRHQWRYDVGGYAWDNSELSPDLFFWNYFLRTGREDVYRFAEALVRHTGEVDVYHLGDLKGLGTRHGVQHWGDSAKQARISTPQYRKVFYFLTGGDERTGEIVQEILDADKTYGILDPNRKVRTDGWVPTPNSSVAVGLGTDWSSLAASWLLEWERRGPRWEEARTKLTNTAASIARLKNGFVTGSGLYNLADGTLGPPPSDPDNNGLVAVSHLSAVFGLLEVVAEFIEHAGADVPEGFEQAWYDYSYYYGAGTAEQTARYGRGFGNLNLKQGHSRLTAYAAHRNGNATLAARAWNEFFNTDGLKQTSPWSTVRFNGSEVLAPIDEAAWISTNDAALYGLAAIINLALVGDSLA
ncbi:secreted protein [Colletotrichum higginsianum]|nr:secreted protein [Colletotrichum higginsianum]